MENQRLDDMPVGIMTEIIKLQKYKVNIILPYSHFWFYKIILLNL
jgi:hypothetical protein